MIYDRPYTRAITYTLAIKREILFMINGAEKYKALSRQNGWESITI